MDNIQNIMPLLIGAISVVVWLIRVESKVSYSEREIDELKKQLSEFDSKILAKLSEIAERLSYIEGGIRGGHAK